jgi:LuxR family maltose regulon positive regulatory protein
MILMANLKLAITLGQMGQFDQVIEICKQQIQFANENGMPQTAAVGWALVIWAEVLAEFDDVDRAILQAKKGLELTKHGGDVGILGWSYVCLTRILFTSGDMTGAEATIREMEQIARETDLPPWMMQIIATWQARIWLAQDNLQAATQWMQERGLGVSKVPTLLYEMEFGIVSARIYMAQRRLDEALAYFPRLFEVAQAGGRTTRALEILILQALAHYVNGDTDLAISVLERALTLAQSMGYFRIFVDEGPPMARLLYETLTRNIAPEYVQRLLAAFPVSESAHALPLKTQAPESDLIEPLSERELEVLELFSQGLTNSEIASKLFLSPHTVKTHSSNIYSKLGVHRRTQAVARARALGLLSSA